MRVLVSGSSGLIGRAVLARLASAGHAAEPLVRSEPAKKRQVVWDPERRRFDAEAAEGADAVVHLAGESIGGGRWTAARKRKIRDSRVDGTRFLATRLLALRDRPRVFVCASAIGFYGDRGEELVDEGSEAGSGFLADVCREWEVASRSLGDAGIRVVSLRFGVVLSPEGGALRQMLPIFRAGLGGRIGSGDQWMSWISLDDAAAIVLLALTSDRLAGPVNAVSPEAVRNRDFTRVLGAVLRRPTVFPVPAFVARLALGEMADALLLSSTRVRPSVLEGERYEFQYRRLEEALRSMLER